MRLEKPSDRPAEFVAALLPGAPAGRYVVMQFDASFAGRKSAAETVTFLLDRDGKWRSAGYFIR